MAYQSSVKLRGLSLNCDIGSYGINEVVPNKHRLDMELLVEKNLILVEEDKMDNVFDYDPLVEEITQISLSGKFNTQEKLITLILKACLKYHQVKAVSLFLYKTPVREDGELGITVNISEQELEKLRQHSHWIRSEFLFLI